LISFKAVVTRSQQPSNSCFLSFFGPVLLAVLRSPLSSVPELFFQVSGSCSCTFILRACFSSRRVPSQEVYATVFNRRFPRGRHSLHLFLEFFGRLPFCLPPINDDLRVLYNLQDADLCFVARHFPGLTRPSPSSFETMRLRQIELVGITTRFSFALRLTRALFFAPPPFFPLTVVGRAKPP